VPVPAYPPLAPAAPLFWHALSSLPNTAQQLFQASGQITTGCKETQSPPQCSTSRSSATSAFRVTQSHRNDKENVRLRKQPHYGWLCMCNKFTKLLYF